LHRNFILIDLNYELIFRVYFGINNVDLNQGRGPFEKYDYLCGAARPPFTISQRPLGLARSEAVQALLVAKRTNIKPFSDILTLFKATSAALVRAFVKSGVDPNARDINGHTTLFTSQTVEKSRALVQAGADPNITDKSGETALFKATAKETVGVLLAAGAERLLVSKSGQTALHIQQARKRRYSACSPHGEHQRHQLERPGWQHTATPCLQRRSGSQYNAVDLPDDFGH
jgi:hypothetical protein